MKSIFCHVIFLILKSIFHTTIIQHYPPIVGVGVHVGVFVGVGVIVASGVFVGVGGSVAVGVTTPEIKYTRLITSPRLPIKPRSFPLYVILKAAAFPVSIIT